MIVTTTGSVEGRSVSSYLSVYAGAAVVGAKIVRDMFASVRDVVGGGSGSYEKVLRCALEDALEAITEATVKLRADAIIGIALDYEVVGDGGSVLMVIDSGAVMKLA